LATSTEIVITSRTGLHARPATLFAKTASKFSASVTVENLTKTSKPINAKSVLHILSAGIAKDSHLRISADGSDEKEAVAALVQLIETNFGEGN
jgi:Phosphotransferase System HPr (HPr) Family